jgi:predicted outer membrane protein
MSDELTKLIEYKRMVEQQLADARANLERAEQAVKKAREEVVDREFALEMIEDDIKRLKAKDVSG